MDNYFTGVFKLTLMIVISLGLYIYFKDISMALITPKDIKGFLLSTFKNDLSSLKSELKMFYNLINITFRVSIISVFVYTIIHWCFKFFDINSVVYVLVAYTMQQINYVYTYMETAKTTEAIQTVAMNNFIYSSLGSILASFVFIMAVKRYPSIS